MTNMLIDLGNGQPANEMQGAIKNQRKRLWVKMKIVNSFFHDQAGAPIDFIPRLGGKIVVRQHNLVSPVANPVHERQDRIIPFGITNMILDKNIISRNS